MSKEKVNKGEVYAEELQKARLRGNWQGTTSVLGKPLPWSEVIRKYTKHNPNNTLIANIAAAEQKLRSCLLNFFRESEFNDVSHEKDDAMPGGKGKTLFSPKLSVQKSGIGWSGSEFEETSNLLEDYAEQAGNNQSLRQSVIGLHAYALFSMGEDEDAVSLLHDSKFLETVNTDQVRPESATDEYHFVLYLLGFVTYGMANERLHYGRPRAGYLPFAYAGYARAIELHEELRGGKRAKALPGLPEDEIERWAEVAMYRNALLSVREGDNSLGLNALRAYQAQVARWPSNFRLPERGVVNRVYLRVLNRAAETGQYSPPPTLPEKSQEDWRSQAYQRNVLAAVAARLNIRDFDSERAARYGPVPRILGSGGINKVTSRTVSKRRPDSSRLLPSPPVTWSNEMLTVSHAAAATVERGTEFPRAGKVNLPALNLADKLVRSWKLNGSLGGDYADELVDSLYTLSRLTFHSQRISRHLFEILTAAEAFDEARSALELYISIVDKAREGDAAGSAGLVEESKLREKKQEEEGYDLEEIKKKEKEEEDKPQEEKEKDKKRSPRKGSALSARAKETASQVLVDSDDNETFITTILRGAYVLWKYCDDAAAADKLARKALDLVGVKSQQDTYAANKVFLGKVYRVAGQTRAVLCLRDPEPSSLAKLQNEALTLLKQSVEADPESAEAWYALAYLQGQMHELQPALRSARKAVELEPADVASWHLLVLLLSAQKDYSAAFELAEVALEEAEQDDDVDLELVNAGAGGQLNASLSGTVSPNGSSRAIEVRTRLLSVDFPPSPSERAEAILQLMMTQNALEEVVNGAEPAIESQKESFAFFHERISRHVRPMASGGGGTALGTAVNGHGPMNGSVPGPLPPPKTAHQGSVSGLGESGSSGYQLATPNSPHRFSASNGKAVNGGVASAMPPPASFFGGPPPADRSTATPRDNRIIYQLRREIYLLTSLWLASAASFRRSNRAEECRAAIQEAEKVDPGRAEVWIQLALLLESGSEASANGPTTSSPSSRRRTKNEETGDLKVAVNALYKALACEADSVSASVHLARIFLTHDASVFGSAAFATRRSGRSVQEQKKDRAIGGGPGAADDGGVDDGEADDEDDVDGANHAAAMALHEGSSDFASLSTPDSSAASIKSSHFAAHSSALSLAEGLLIATTSGKGWQSPEAWLFLGRVCKKTDRRARERECLKYALKMQQGRPVRDLQTALDWRPSSLLA